MKTEYSTGIAALAFLWTAVRCIAQQPPSVPWPSVFEPGSFGADSFCRAAMRATAFVIIGADVIAGNLGLPGCPSHTFERPVR
jgi:hypothetical protein